MSKRDDALRHWSRFRKESRRIIFGSDRKDEKLFDVVLIAAIAVSVLVVMLDSVAAFRARYGPILYWAEWTFTIVFTLEYAFRIWVSKRPARYIFSFFGVVDLLAILPSYLSLMLPGAQFLMVFRALRVLRIFRVLKMAEYVGEATLIGRSLRASARKITIFLFWVLTLVLILGSFMYLIEGPENGFTSIPKSVYWAIVTLTTVGYGDISPQTPLGQLLSVTVMITGYGIIAVPTGIVTAEIAFASRDRRKEVKCPKCGVKEHQESAKYCRECGAPLEGE